LAKKLAKIAIEDHLEFSNAATPINVRSSRKTVRTHAKLFAKYVGSGMRYLTDA
jgi:hypothetical protein